jgi:mRNA interferase RelE/StbE
LTKYKVLVSKTAISQLDSLDASTKERIKAGLEPLEEEPFQRRSGADVKRLALSSDPPLYRLRIGDYRVIYTVVEDEVRITEIIHRSKGYKWLE